MEQLTMDIGKLGFFIAGIAFAINVAIMYKEEGLALVAIAVCVFCMCIGYLFSWAGAPASMNVLWYNTEATAIALTLGYLAGKPFQRYFYL
jgi:hypothetical protein